MLWRRRGNRDSFERESQKIFDSLYRTARRLTRNPDDAEDLVQEALVRGFEAYDRFDGRNFKAWMLKILSNLYINKYRVQQRTPTFESIEDAAGAESIASEEHDPGMALQEGLLSEQVEDALAQLPDEYRITVMLCDIEGLTYEEISDVLNVPIGTVRSRIARGRERLRELLLEFAQKEGYLRGK